MFGLVPRPALAGVALCSGFLVSPATAASDSSGLLTRTPASYERSAMVFGGGSVVLIGSQERRVVLGAALRGGRIDPRLSLDRLPGRLLYEVNTTYSNGSRKGRPRNTYFTVSTLALLHYRFPLHGGVRFYSEVGWGLLVTNRISTDINNALNSTPVVGVGVVIPSRGDELFLGVRFTHISNAGTNLPNKGQNQVVLTLGWRW